MEVLRDRKHLPAELTLLFASTAAPSTHAHAAPSAASCSASSGPPHGCVWCSTGLRPCHLPCLHPSLRTPCAHQCAAARYLRPHPTHPGLLGLAGHAHHAFDLIKLALVRLCCAPTMKTTSQGSHGCARVCTCYQNTCPQQNAVTATRLPASVRQQPASLHKRQARDAHTARHSCRCCSGRVSRR